MENIYTMDWHIHTIASYDATQSYAEVIKRAKEIGITEFGITEHVNYPFMSKHLQVSQKMFDQEMYKQNGEINMHFGVELSPMSNYQQKYSEQHEWRLYPPLLAGMLPEFVDLGSGVPELVRLGHEQAEPWLLALTEEELREEGVEYVIAAAHVVFNTPIEPEALIRHWHAQQMMCATDSRVDVVGHPWQAIWSPEIHREMLETGRVTERAWFGDFKIIPQSMHDEFAAALIENGKCAELNMYVFCTDMFSDKFKCQYAEYIRMLFEKGVSITTGSDFHDSYDDVQELCAKYLAPVGFTAKDFSRPKFREYK